MAHAGEFLAIGGETERRGLVPDLGALATQVLAYHGTPEGGPAVGLDYQAGRAVVQSPQRPANPNPTTGTSGTHTKFC